MTGRWVLPLGSAEREDWAVVVDEGVDGLAVHRPVCGFAPARGGARAVDRGARAHRRAALRVGRGPVHRVLGRRVDGAADRPRLGLRRTGRRRLRPPRQRPRARDDRAVPGRPRRRRAARRAGRRRFPASSTCERPTCPSSCAEPAIASREVRNFGVPGVLEADVAHRLRGRHPGRQLELVPAAQARRPPRGRRVAARGDLLLRGPGRATARPRAPTRSATCASTARRTATDRRARRGADRRRRARALRLARAGDGRSRLRPVLPQRHGGTRPGAGLADLRRPGHAWVRETWTSLPVDPRIPLGGPWRGRQAPTGGSVR